MSGWVHDTALGLGIYVGVSLIVGPLAARFFAVANAQHHRSMSQEQRLRGGNPERAGRLPVGGEIGDQHSTLVASQE